ncbi:MAG TPA: neutral zinc metallopeptidase [Gemmatimonadaceae bacterium]|nr:neutral zinc metallopeptidase [Gemmatimonadaceae bacterium]
MRWTPGGESGNIEDRRGSSGGGFGMAPMGIGGTLVLIVLSLIFGRNFVGGGGDTNPGPQQTASGDVAPAQQSPEEAREVQFVSFVLDSAQAVWSRLEPRAFGQPWHDAKLVLYRNATQTGCGVGQETMGPFYCPNDEKVYIDLAFYDELRTRFGAPGEFAQAYVLAHELGHHVQHINGLDRQVRRLQQSNPGEANALSVRLELQADCYAGVFGHEMQNENILDPGDIDDGLRAASAVGDDRLQQQATGHVNIDSFTHGSSAQRSSWFRKGFDSGDPKACDTFADVRG